jgi:hypothetical protein
MKHQDMSIAPKQLANRCPLKRNLEIVDSTHAAELQNYLRLNVRMNPPLRFCMPWNSTVSYATNWPRTEAGYLRPANDSFIRL